MSLANQQFTFGSAGVVAYASGEAVTAGAGSMLLLSFDVSGGHFMGLSIGLGVADAAAWAAGLEFDLFVGGTKKITIDDELCTLLQKEFLPMDLQQNTKIELFAKNKGGADVLVSAFLRVEAG